MKKLISALLVLALAAGICVPVWARAKKIRLSPSETILIVGQDREMLVTFTPASETEELTWRSSDEEIATVDSASGNTAVVTAHKRGSAVISVKTESGLRSSCTVTVRKEGQSIRASGMEMSLPFMTVRVDQTRSLWVLFTPNDTTEEIAEWSSSNPDVATVDAEGTVTGVAPGTATITARSDGGATTNCSITVPGNYVKEFEKNVEVLEPQNGSEMLSSAAARTAVATAARSTTKGSVGTAVFKNKTSVTPTVIGAAAYSANEANRNIHLRFTTSDSEDKTLGTITFDPQEAKTRKEDLRTVVSAHSSRAAALQKSFKTYFSNRYSVIECASAGELGFSAQISVQTNLTGAQSENLRFYTYNSDTNRYSDLTVKNASIDQNGFLRFSTTTGGTFIVSNGELQKK